MTLSSKLHALGETMPTRPKTIDRTHVVGEFYGERQYLLALESLAERLADRVAEAEANECGHLYESNPGLWDTSRRYCSLCGRVEP